MNDEMSDPVMSPILVTGGTGTLGRLVVARLRDAGRDVRVLSRGRREGAEDVKRDRGIESLIGDLATGEGIDAAVKERRSSSIVPAAPKATGTRHGTWFGPRRGRGRGTWSTSRSSAPTGSPSPAASTARCSATSGQSLPQSGPWPTPACRGPPCALPSSMT